MRRSYNKAIDSDQKYDPYQSMYSQAFGNRTKQTETKQEYNQLETINYQQ